MSFKVLNLGMSYIILNLIHKQYHEIYMRYGKMMIFYDDFYIWNFCEKWEKSEKIKFSFIYSYIPGYMTDIYNKQDNSENIENMMQ